MIKQYEELIEERKYFVGLIRSFDDMEHDEVTQIWNEHGQTIWDKASGKPMPEFYVRLLGEGS